MTRVFVYGTLKPGGLYYPRYCADQLASQVEAYVRGQLYHLPQGYPAMTTGDRPVYGWLLTFCSAASLVALDALEGYSPTALPEQNEYLRLRVKVYSLQHQSLGTAWAYWMTAARIKQFRGQPLPQGTWPAASQNGVN